MVLKWLLQLQFVRVFKLWMVGWSVGLIDESLPGAKIVSIENFCTNYVHSLHPFPVHYTDRPSSSISVHNSHAFSLFIEADPT